MLTPTGLRLSTPDGLLSEATAEDDVILIATAGAYGFSMANRYNQRALPREELLDD